MSGMVAWAAVMRSDVIGVHPHHRDPYPALAGGVDLRAGGELSQFLGDGLERRLGDPHQPGFLIGAQRPLFLPLFLVVAFAAEEVADPVDLFGVGLDAVELVGFASPSGGRIGAFIVFVGHGERLRPARWLVGCTSYLGCTWGVPGYARRGVYLGTPSGCGGRP